MLDIFLPTYKRADRLQAVAKNIEQATRNPFTLYFGCEPGDAETIEVAQATGHKVVVNTGRQGYADTIQTIYEQSDGDVFFHANDDFEFFEGWDVAPLQFLEEHPEIQVVGADDGMPTPSYSTISFIRREYIEQLSGVADMPNRVFYPYHHNYVDTEFTYTAQARGLWAKLEGPCIKHHRLPMDETYEKNNATSPKDQETFNSRKDLWESLSKEDINMARKPMSEERKKALSEQAKARHATKKAEQASTTPEVSTNDSRPPVSETTPSAQVARALQQIEAAYETLSAVRNTHPDMIEAAQVVEALSEARAKTGQVQGILSNK